MINKYFDIVDTNGMDESVDGVIQYYDCRLLQDIGKFPKDYIMPVIAINYNEGWIHFYNKDNEIVDKLKLSVVITPE